MYADVLVDSNVLLDILEEYPNWYEWSSTQLQKAAEHSSLIINPIIYADSGIGKLGL